MSPEKAGSQDVSPEKKKKGGFKSLFGRKKKSVKHGSEEVLTSQEELDRSGNAIPARGGSLTLPPVDSSHMFSEEEEVMMGNVGIQDEPEEIVKVAKSVAAESPKRPVPPARKQQVEGEVAADNNTPPIPAARVKPPLPRRSNTSKSDEKIPDPIDAPEVFVRPRPPVTASHDSISDVKTPERPRPPVVAASHDSISEAKTPERPRPHVAADATTPEPATSPEEVAPESVVAPRRKIPGLVAIPGMPGLPAGGLPPKLRPKPVTAAFASSDQLEGGGESRPPVPIKPKPVVDSRGDLSEDGEGEVETIQPHLAPRTSPPMVCMRFNR
jgi:hypothetical protein